LVDGKHQTHEIDRSDRDPVESVHETHETDQWARKLVSYARHMHI
jgi:hypothetical protein